MTAPKFLSIVGEQQAQPTEMDQGDVDQYVSNATDAIVQCRESGHRFNSVRNGVVFTGVDGDGMLIRELPCTQCECVKRVEHWMPYKQGRQTRYRCEHRTLVYGTGPNGERYIAPAGHGRMTRQQIRDSLMTNALNSFTLSEIRKAAIKEIKKGD